MGFSLDQDAAYVIDEVRNHGTVTDLIAPMTGVRVASAGCCSPRPSA